MKSNNIIKKWWIKLKSKKESFSFVLEIGAIVLALVSLGLELRVKKDTEELTKLSEKPIYYTIRLYPTEEMYEYTENDKYVWLNLQLVIDDFEIINNSMSNVNYNATFTHKKYFMVYDYEQENEGNKYYYFVNKLNAKTEAKLRLEDELYATMTGANYSKTPNNKYIYILVYTETLSEQNLDLVYFEYIENENGISLQYETNENGDIEIAKEIINKDTYICKDYYIEQWSNGELEKKQDLEFMFDVYRDLKEKVTE